MVNWIAPYPQLSSYFVRECNGIPLLMDALRFSKEDYARVFAMRSLTLFAFTQKDDGDVERRLMQCNGMKQVVDSYRQSSGDPTDTRFLTLLLSSLLRHFPQAAGREFIEARGVESIVNNLNIARYKGFPQHLRVLRDAQHLPQSVSSAPVDKLFYEADFIPVALGILEAFPEFYGVVGDLLHTLDSVGQYARPIEMLEYRALHIFAKLYSKYQNDTVFQTDGTRKKLAELARRILNDSTCQRCFDPSVATRELTIVLNTMNHLIRADESKFVTAAASV